MARLPGRACRIGIRQHLCRRIAVVADFAERIHDRPEVQMAEPGRAAVGIDEVNMRDGARPRAERRRDVNFLDVHVK